MAATFHLLREQADQKRSAFLLSDSELGFASFCFWRRNYCEMALTLISIYKNE